MAALWVYDIISKCLPLKNVKTASTNDNSQSVQYNAAPKFMKGMVKSAPVSRSDVMVKSVMAKSAL